MTAPAASPGAGFLAAFTFRRGLLLAAGAFLAWQALRGMPWTEAWGQVTGMGLEALLLLCALNLAILPLMTVRWWQLLRTFAAPVGLRPVCSYRFAANAVSLLTPGPHFGGEPLLVYLLHRRHGIALPVAATSVTLDRILEFWAGVVVLSGSLLILTVTGSGPFSGGWPLTTAMAAMAALALVLAALFMGLRPLSRLGLLVARLRLAARMGRTGTAGGWLAAIAQGEDMAESLASRHRRAFVLANLYSLGQWLAVFAEFWLMAALLGHPLPFTHLATVVLAARLAFLTPLPAGLGALETALPWVTAALGLGHALGLGLCLLIRLRDLFFSLAGLGLALKYLTCPGGACTLTEKAR